MFEDPRFLSQYQLSAEYDDTDEGKYRNFAWRKPFWSLEDSDAFQFEAWGDNTKADIYQEGGESIEIAHDKEHAAFDWIHEYGNPLKSKRLNLSLGWDAYHYLENHESIVVPPKTEDVHLSAAYTWDTRYRYLELTHIDSLNFTEDISEHLSVTVGAGTLQRHRSSNDEVMFTWQSELQQIKTWNKAILAWSLAGSGRHNDQGGLSAVNIASYGHLYHKATERQTWALGLAYQRQYTNDDLYLPLTLGEDNGLRGYPAFSLTGDKTGLLNLEHRLRYGWPHGRLALGQVLFIDGGFALDPHQTFNQDLIHWSAGWGLRLGLPSLLGKRVARIDFAYPLDGGSISVSASVGQVLQFDRINQGFSKDY